MRSFPLLAMRGTSGTPSLWQHAALARQGFEEERFSLLKLAEELGGTNKAIMTDRSHLPIFPEKKSWCLHKNMPSCVFLFNLSYGSCCPSSKPWVFVQALAWERVGTFLSPLVWKDVGRRYGEVKSRFLVCWGLSFFLELGVWECMLCSLIWLLYILVIFVYFYIYIYIYIYV